MPRYPAQGQPKRAFVNTEFHPAIKQYLVDLGDDTGVSPPKIVRLCVERALPEIEALLRSGEDPPDRLNRARAGKPVKEEEPMKYKPLPPPLPPPAIVGVLTGEAVPGISLEFVNHGDEPAEEIDDSPEAWASPPSEDESMPPEDPPASVPEDPASPPPAVPPRRRRRG